MNSRCPQCLHRLPEDARSIAIYCSDACRAKHWRKTKKREGVSYLLAATEALEAGNHAEWSRLTDLGRSILATTHNKADSELIARLVDEILSARDAA